MSNRMSQGPGTTPRQHLLLYDGECALCNRLVTFILRRDAQRVFDFAALQSGLARQQRHTLGDESEDDTVRVVAGYRTTAPVLLSRSAAVFFMASALGRPWRWLAVARIVPRPLRDALYDLVARYRYHVFGRSRECVLPRPEDRARFVDQVQP